MSTYTHSNGYSNGDTKLACGNTITIQDGTYNAAWMVAGFDVESVKLASDETTYDNGYGIALVPKIQVTTGKWNTSNTVSGAYKSSLIHTSTLPTVATNLKKVLGSHLIQRNVLLSSSVNSSYYSNAYTWTTAYATLMSVGQINGTFASHRNKYDDGEANYQLPVFQKTSYETGSNFWLRGIYGSSSSNEYYYAYYHMYDFHSISNCNTYIENGIRPLIYIR